VGGGRQRRGVDARRVSAHNWVDPGFGKAYPCVGVYADVLEPGEVRVGDAVHLA
jgi:MOSC domain-containing protein YiiM